MNGKCLTKRFVDLALSITGLILAAPLLLSIALLIRLSSAGPILIRQERVGRQGRVFVMYKFRTMREGADRSLQEEIVHWDGPIFRIKNDTRITPGGRLLRHFNLDELPQLVNVIRGDMSLVGPRPHLLEEALRYEAWHKERLVCRPGITCTWQASASRHEISFAEWIEMDLRYIHEQSLHHDLVIIAKTLLQSTGLQ